MALGKWESGCVYHKHPSPDLISLILMAKTRSEILLTSLGRGGDSDPDEIFTGEIYMYPKAKEGKKYHSYGSSRSRTNGGNHLVYTVE